MELLGELLRGLGKSKELGFNVFDVMRYGDHEKLLSHVFKWLFDASSSHNLGDQFQRVFIDVISKKPPEISAKLSSKLPSDQYSVRDEVNTALPGKTKDIADLVLENDSARIVIENYITSDGHGHSYENYSRYSKEDPAKTGLVVLLCRDEDPNLLKKGWEDAVVVTYDILLKRLCEILDVDKKYQENNLEAYSFIKQMYAKFSKERIKMEDLDALSFVATMCQADQAGLYQIKQVDRAADQFATEMADTAKNYFRSGRSVLNEIKGKLYSFCKSALTDQLNKTLEENFVHNVSIRGVGLYQWSICFDIYESDNNYVKNGLLIKFGPSAWHACVEDKTWNCTHKKEELDFMCLFILRNSNSSIRQSRVRLEEVLQGLEPTDTRLHNEIVDFLKT